MIKLKNIIKRKLKNNQNLVRILEYYNRRRKYLLNKLFSRINYNENIVKEKCITTDPGEYFFGYYDKSPWCKTGKYILALRAKNTNRNPKKDEDADIGIIDTKDNYNFINLRKTKAWNLQQGCMFQWLGPDFDTKIIYNDIIENEYVSVIYNIDTEETRVLKRPVYSISRDGKKALSLNFSRLHRLRPGYGYSSLEDETEDIPIPSDDGIWLIDIEKNRYKLLISIGDIASINWNSDMGSGHHWFNHLEMNPDGKRFSFLHRWESKGRRCSRLFTADIEGKNIYCIVDDRMISHCCWKNSRQILSWARVAGSGEHYYLFTDLEKKFEIIGEGILNEDGHPSYSPEGRYILTDTYPDKSRLRRLIIYDTKTNRQHELGKYLAPFKYDFEYRCDLHPRWSRDGKLICFDSTHEGNRRMYIVPNPLQ